MIQILINNEEVVCDKDLTIEEQMLSTSSIILNNVYPKSWENDKDYTSRFYYPQDLSMCKILKDNGLIFAGLVKNTGNISLNPRYPHYCSVQVLSFSDFLSTGDTLDFVINEKTVLEAIQMVIDSVSEYGFVLGNVDIIGGNDVIGAYNTQNKTAYDVFQYLADITQSRWTARMVDEDTIAIDFYDPSLMPEGTEIDYTEEWFEDNNINDMTFNYGTYDYRNKQVMLSDQVYGDIDYTDTVIADGYNTTYSVSSPVALMTSIAVNGVAATFATTAEKELGIDADFYYSAGESNIESSITYTAGTVITVTYTPLVQGRQVIYNNAEVSRVTSQLNRRGVITRYENRNDVFSSDELQQIGQSYIKYKGYPEINLTIDTENNIWEVGQTVFFNAPLTELTTSYMVKSKTTTIITTANRVFYTYTLTSSFNSEQEINYFDNQRSKNTGNIESGEFITRNIDVENEALIIFSNLVVTESSVTGDNILNSVLDSPFTQ